MISSPATAARFRAFVRGLCFAALLGAAPVFAAIPAGAAVLDAASEAREAASLAVDRSAQGYIFPRDGLSVQVSVTSRKKLLPAPPVTSGEADEIPALAAEPSAPSGNTLQTPAATEFRFSSIACHVWRSRAPPPAG